MHEVLNWRQRKNPVADVVCGRVNRIDGHGNPRHIFNCNVGASNHGGN